MHAATGGHGFVVVAEDVVANLLKAGRCDSSIRLNHSASVCQVIADAKGATRTDGVRGIVLTQGSVMGARMLGIAHVLPTERAAHRKMAVARVEISIVLRARGRG
jgi:hypothetical protein